jgi:hypothetical protein
MLKVKVSLKKGGGSDVIALRFQDHCTVLYKFREKVSRLNSVLHAMTQKLQDMIGIFSSTIV